MFSKGIAWVLWGLSWMGLGGLHRFYLGKPITGLLYLGTWNLLGIGLIADAFTLNEQVDIANERRRKELMAMGALPQLGPGDGEQRFMKELLRAASSRGGRLTVTEAVMATGRDFAEVEAQLEKMRKTGYVDIDNHPETGVVQYRFPELESGSRNS
ncbi:MAG: NINE protein [Myxococcota bacterium]